MRIELDKPLTKTKLRQALKMIGNDAKKIKIIMGTEIFDIDTIISDNGTMYLCTDTKATSDFYEKRVVDKESDKDDILDIDLYQNKIYHFVKDDTWNEKWEEYRKKHGLSRYHIGDTPGFNDDCTCEDN